MFRNFGRCGEWDDFLKATADRVLLVHGKALDFIDRMSVHPPQLLLLSAVFLGVAEYQFADNVDLAKA